MTTKADLATILRALMARMNRMRDLAGLKDAIVARLQPTHLAKETLIVLDDITLVCRLVDGSVKWTNTPIPGHSITNTGMALVSGLILTDVGGTACDYIGIGDSNTAEDASHTDLQAVTNKVRKTATGTQVTTTQTNDTAQLVATFSSSDTPSGTWSVQEAAVFNAAAAGTMLFRKIFTAKSCDWDAGDTLEVTAKCQVKQGA